MSTDSIALAGFVKLTKAAKVLDLGSGCGTLGTLLCAQNSFCNVTGIELDENAHKAALINIARNDLASRLSSICADVNAISEYIRPGSFQCCVSNPPYFQGGPDSKTLVARRNDTLSTEALFAAAGWALQYGGDFFLVHKPEMLGHLCAAGAKHNLEAKRLCLLRHSENGPVSLILLQLRKGGKPGLILEEAALHKADGSPTNYYRKLYHLEG